MATRIQVRRDTAANWTSTNPTPAQGEFCYETDTKLGKVGDGTTAWTALKYSWVADVSTLALLASPAFTGNPTAPTQSKFDSSTKLATTAFVRAHTGLIPITPTSIAYTGTSATLTGNVIAASAVTQLRLNGIFTSSFTHYLIELLGKTNVADVLRARLAVGGVTNSSAHYNQQTRIENNTTVSPGQILLGTSIAVGYFDTLSPAWATVEVWNPQQSEMTHMRNECVSKYNLGGNYCYTTRGDFDLTTSFDGLDIIPDAQQWTGAVRLWAFAS